MREIVVVGKGLAHKIDEVPATLRRASRNMILAVNSISSALANLPVSGLGERLGLIVGTNSGELETSAEFMLTLARENLARPILFQNSLHNATAGFATIQFGVKGPTFTLSAGENNVGECLELARNVIERSQADVMIVTLVEAHKSMTERLGFAIAEGAATVVVASRLWAEANSCPFCSFEDAAKLRLERAQSPFFSIGFEP